MRQQKEGKTCDTNPFFHLHTHTNSHGNAHFSSKQHKLFENLAQFQPTKNRYHHRNGNSDTAKQIKSLSLLPLEFSSVYFIDCFLMLWSVPHFFFSLHSIRTAAALSLSLSVSFFSLFPSVPLCRIPFVSFFFCFRQFFCFFHFLLLLLLQRRIFSIDFAAPLADVTLILSQNPLSFRQMTDIIDLEIFLCVLICIENSSACTARASTHLAAIVL